MVARMGLQVFARLHSGSAVCEEGGGVRRRLEYVESRENASWTRKGLLSSDVCCIFTIFYTAASLPLSFGTISIELPPLCADVTYTCSKITLGAWHKFYSTQATEELSSACPQRSRIINAPCREVVTQCNSRLYGMLNKER